MSWRVWARETLCCPPQPERTIVPAIDIPSLRTEEVPSLSNSPGSESDESISSLEHSALGKSRGHEPHLTPAGLEKIIVKIHETDNIEPLDPAIEACVAGMSPENHISKESSLASHNSAAKPANYNVESSCISTATNTTSHTASTECDAQHRNSDTSVSSDGLIRSGSVVHGFSPIPSVRARTGSSLSKAMPIATQMRSKGATPKKTAMFTMGGSSDDESSFEQHMSYRKQMLEPRKSSLSKTLGRDDKPHQTKTTSFREVVEQRQIQTGGSPGDDNAIASDEEDEESAIEDSAIEEDDDEGWEDEQPDEEKPPSEPVFRRVDSTAHLQSRRSILTQGLTEGDRAKGLLNAASRSSPAIRRMDNAAPHNGSSLLAGSPDENDEDAEDGPVMMRSTNLSRGIPISPPKNQAAYTMAHSPRTTRRNMLSTELTESLRKNLLWERQQKNTTVNAFLKREARSLANLQKAGQVPQSDQRPPPADDTRNNDSYNDCFNVVNEYHTKGW